MGTPALRSSFDRLSVGESSLMKGSEECFAAKPSCDPCKSKGDEIEAIRYCNDCKNYLCDACFKSHEANSLSAHHTFLDQHNISKLAKSDDSGSKQLSGAVAAGNQPKNKEFVFEHKINVKTCTDENDCYIERMAIVSNKELAIIDIYNKSLKIVDTDFKTVTRSLKFKSKPQGMTKISNNRVAVTFPLECNIEIICTSDGITVVQILKTGGQCLGICYKNEKLYVSFLNKFQILRMTGAVQRTIRLCADALQHCKYPSGLAVSPDEMSIFVSDIKSHKLMRIGLNGTLLCIYQDELDAPRDIIVSPFGSLYLFVANYHCLYEVKSDLSEATVLLGLGDGLTFPNAMCFDELKQQLYVSTASTDGKLNNDLKVYKRK